MNFEAVIREIITHRSPVTNLDPADPNSLSVVEAARQGSSEALTHIMYAYAGTVRKLRKKFPGPRFSVEDFASAVGIGTVEALREVDDRLGGGLAKLIVLRTSDELTKMNMHIAVPDRTLHRYYAIGRAARKEAMAEGKDATIFDELRVAGEHKMSVTTYMAVRNAVSTSVVSPLPADGEDEAPGLPDLISARLNTKTARGGRRAPRSDELVYDPEVLEADAELVEAAFAVVDDLEAEVCHRAYAFEEYGFFNPQGDAEIAMEMGLSRQKVQRVRAGALKKMRRALGADEDAV